MENLNLKNFEMIDDTMFYESADHYYIDHDRKSGGFRLRIESINPENGEVEDKTYSFSSLSLTIAAIETLENGGEV